MAQFWKSFFKKTGFDKGTLLCARMNILADMNLHHTVGISPPMLFDVITDKCG